MDFSLLCFDTTINPYRLYGRGTHEGMTMTDSELLQFMQLFSFFFIHFFVFFFFEFFALLVKNNGVRLIRCSEQKGSAAANFYKVDD